MSLPKFEAPKPKLKRRRQVEINFIAPLIAAGAYGGQSSGNIGYPFRIVRGSIVFTEEHNYNVEVQFRVDGGNQITTTGHSSGLNIFGRENPQASFRGRGIIKRINTNVEFPDGRLFLKMSAWNNTPYVQSITGSLVVEEM